MTGTWFECKVRYAKMNDSGNEKKVTETYVVDALSFSEAEARIIKEVTPYIENGFEITDIKKARYSEVFDCAEDAADRWYKCKLYFITVDESTGNEKKTAVNMLVKASGFRDALDRLEREMKGTMADYEVASITDTNVMDVYMYEAGGSRSADDDKALDIILPEGKATEVTIYNKVYIVDKTGGKTKVTPKETDECSRQTKRSSQPSANG